MVVALGLESEDIGFPAAMLGNGSGSFGSSPFKGSDGEGTESLPSDRHDDVLTFNGVFGHFPNERDAPTGHVSLPNSSTEQLGSEPLTFDKVKLTWLTRREQSL